MITRPLKGPITLPLKLCGFSELGGIANIFACQKRMKVEMVPIGSDQTVLTKTSTSSELSGVSV